ncbi:MAG: TPM domain-containing protein [Verrucomicrobia bacterium]|nr:TPM domain-containing protein [Verrucomicrobiota bacterium]
MDIPIRNIRLKICYVAFSALCFMAVYSASATEIKLDPPGERDFIRDHAGLLDKVSKYTIKSISGALLRDETVPIIVVTVESMDKYGGENMDIETFAGLLFDQWRIGHSRPGEDYTNKGILLLVSKDDRKARIELGKGWGRRESFLSRQVMALHIIPQFKRGNFSAGIVAGVKALDRVGRKQKLPISLTSFKQFSGGDWIACAVYFGGELKFFVVREVTMPMKLRPWWHYVIFGLLVFSIVSTGRKGSRGWAWQLWSNVFGSLGSIIMFFLSSGSDDDDDGFFSGGSFGGNFTSSIGSFSGGSFGGGSSGGSGATGSW